VARHFSTIPYRINRQLLPGKSVNAMVCRDYYRTA